MLLIFVVNIKELFLCKEFSGISLSVKTIRNKIKIFFVYSKFVTKTTKLKDVSVYHQQRLKYWRKIGLTNPYLWKRNFLMMSLMP